MTAHFGRRDISRRNPVPVDDLLTAALARLRRQKQYARVLSRDASASTGLDQMLDRATECVTALARAEVVFMPVSAHATGDETEIAGRVTLSDARLAQDLSKGGCLTAYLMTLGYSQADAFEMLQGDYMAHHVQTDLASEVLFSLGRLALRMQQADHPGQELRRISVQATELCGARKIWDAASVQALLGCFDGINPGVTVTDTGCFQPLNSLLGLTVRL